MKLLEERILREGQVRPGNVLKVDCFLNHQLDVELLDAIGAEFHRIFGGDGINKIVTIEASGIAIACMTARHFGVPVVFAKKAKSKNIDGDVYTSVVHSFTYGRDYDITLSKKFLSSADRVLIVDDFLANGKAMKGLLDVCRQAGGRHRHLHRERLPARRRRAAPGRLQGGQPGHRRPHGRRFADFPAAGLTQKDAKLRPLRAAAAWCRMKARSVHQILLWSGNLWLTKSFPIS